MVNGKSAYSFYIVLYYYIFTKSVNIHFAHTFLCSHQTSNHMKDFLFSNSPAHDWMSKWNTVSLLFTTLFTHFTVVNQNGLLLVLADLSMMKPSQLQNAE